MPLYHPEQLAAPSVDLSKLPRIYLFGTERDPEIYVDVSAVYPQKCAATLAHHSQFPAGEVEIEWMKQRDRAAGGVSNVAYAEPCKIVSVW